MKKPVSPKPRVEETDLFRLRKPARPISVFTPLPASELETLNRAAQSAVNSSPVRIKAVTEIHHANIDAKLFASLTAHSITTGTPVSFQVSKKTSVTVKTDRLEQDSSGTLNWYGHVPGDPNSSVHLIVNEKERFLFGHISVRRTVYEIRPTSSGAHTIFTIDPRRFPPDHSPNKHRQPSRHIEHSPVEKPSGGIPQIDVMVLYTEEAASQPGMHMIDTEVCLARNQMAESFTKSKVRATVRLVHHGRANISESVYEGNIDTLLNDLADPIKGKSIHELRNQYGADVVSVWLSDSFGEADGTTCGATTTLYQASSQNHDAAYSTVVRSCAALPGRMSFAHEMGHLLGANHDRFQDQAAESGEPNWGYVRPDKGWRTIMAYDRADCNDGTCKRLGLWSNPFILHNGDPVGRLPDTQPSGCTNRNADLSDPSTIRCDGPAYNALALNGAAGIVANFRPQASTLGNISCGSGRGDTTPPAPPGTLRAN